MWRQWYTRYLYVLLLTAIEAYWSEQLRVTCAMLQRRVETAAAETSVRHRRGELASNISNPRRREAKAEAG